MKLVIKKEIENYNIEDYKFKDIKAYKIGHYSKEWDIENNLTIDKKEAFLSKVLELYGDGKTIKFDIKYFKKLMKKYKSEDNGIKRTRWGYYHPKSLQKWFKENDTLGIIKLDLDDKPTLYTDFDRNHNLGSDYDSIINQIHYNVLYTFKYNEQKHFINNDSDQIKITRLEEYLCDFQLETGLTEIVSDTNIAKMYHWGSSTRDEKIKHMDLVNDLLKILDAYNKELETLNKKYSDMLIKYNQNQIIKEVGIKNEKE